MIELLSTLLAISHAGLLASTLGFIVLLGCELLLEFLRGYASASFFLMVYYKTLEECFCFKGYKVLNAVWFSWEA